jgi:phosphohistidine phosphatase
MEIYFVRHGPAGERDEWRGDDYERPLTEEGRQLMISVAAGLKGQNISPDLILTSPLVRARQTAEIVAQGLGIPGRLVVEKRLTPGFSAETLAKILRAYPDVTALMLVGHEPDFSTTVGKLIGGGRVICKKGGLAHIEMTNPKSLKGKLVALIPPRMICSES